MLTAKHCPCDGKCRIKGDGEIVSFGDGRFEILRTTQYGYAVCDTQLMGLGLYTCHGHIVEEFCGIDSAKSLIREIEHKLTEIYNPGYYWGR